MNSTYRGCSCFFNVIFFILFGLLPERSLFCQQVRTTTEWNDANHLVVIGTIRMEGNKITHPSIILRELMFHESDTIPAGEFKQVIAKSRENVFNTTLFNFVTFDTVRNSTDPGKTDVNIHLIERWYIWPVPYFLISDRNFNTWLQTTDLSKVTYGIDMTFFNVRGRNETLIFPVHLGFNQLYGVNYKIPYVNRSQTIGLGFGVNYQQNHEVVVNSQNNKPVYYKDPDQFPRRIIDAFAETFLRPNIYTRHSFRVEYSQISFSDSLVKIPGYSFSTTDSKTDFVSFYYLFRNDHRDVQYYPLKGFYLDFSYNQNGFFHESVHAIYLKSSLRKYWHLFNRWYFASGLSWKYTIDKPTCYFLEKGMGYGREIVRGYEYYVIDGQHFIFMKNNLKFALLPERVVMVDFLKSDKFNTIHYALYLNLFIDMGYVSNDDEDASEQNSLQNQFLIGYGAGLDFTTYYDIVIRVEFSMNRMGIPGVYLHFVAPI